MPHNTPEKRHAYREANRERRRKIRKAWYEANREREREKSKVWREANPEQQHELLKAWREANPERAAFHRHRGHAKQRGIAFLLTFSEWFAIWRESGKWAQRGYHKGQYVMARFGDKGPYAVGNVHICSCSENLAERDWERMSRAAHNRQRDERGKFI